MSLTPVSSPSLVVQLARDLQTDFYPHFPDFFVLITSLLDTKDTELLEWVFTSLSYLYKYLWRLMVKDMTNIYRWKKANTVKWIYWTSISDCIFLSNSLYSTLLAHKKEHIRIFAAESFSYLMRKVGGQQISNWRGAFLFNASRITGCLLPGSRHRSSAESHVHRSGGTPWEGWRSWSAALWNVQRSPTHVSLLCSKCKFLTS